MMETDAGAEMLESLLPSKFQYRAKEVKNLEQDEILALLLCSTYFWSWLIQLTKSYKNNGKIVRTGISNSNGHISEPVALHEKLKSSDPICMSILGPGMLFQSFLQCICCHMKRACGSNLCEPNFQEFHLNDDIKIFLSGERERLFGSREREGKLKIPFPFYGKGTGIRKCYGKGREWEI